MKIKFITGMLTGLLLTVSSMANANLITQSEAAEITADGQAFTFNFDSLSNNIDGDVVFFINASGDFSDNKANEYVDIAFSNSVGNLRLDETGLLSGLTGFTLQFFSSVNVVDFWDETFSATFTLSETVVELLQGTSFSITTQNGSGVNAHFAQNLQNSDRDFVEVGFTYATEVPEPTSLAIFALGILGLTARRMTK